MICYKIIVNKKILACLEKNWEDYKLLGRNLRSFPIKFQL
jgi:hypothetical protein